MPGRCRREAIFFCLLARRLTADAPVSVSAAFMFYSIENRSIMKQANPNLGIGKSDAADAGGGCPRAGMHERRVADGGGRRGDALPGATGEVSKLLGANWRTMTDDEKEPYKQKALADKERYKKEMETYVPPPDLDA